MKKFKSLKFLVVGVIFGSILLFMLMTSNTGDLKSRLKNTSWEFNSSDGPKGTILFQEDTAEFFVKDSNGKEEQVKGKFKVNNYTREIKIVNEKKKIVISVANTGPGEFEKGYNTVGMEGFLDYKYPHTIGGVMVKNEAD